MSCPVGHTWPPAPVRTPTRVAARCGLDGADHPENLAAFQQKHPDRRIDGGFYFAKKENQWQPHINPVSTGFGLQALMMWRQYLDGELEFSTNSLI